MAHQRLERIKSAIATWLSSSNVNLAEDASDQLHLVSLEDRVFYSAAPVPVDLVDVVDGGSEGPSVEHVFADADSQLELMSQELDSLVMDEHVADDISLETSDLASFNLDETRTELIVVDQSVDDFQVLVDDILNRSGSEQIQYEIAFIQPDGNGVQQLSNVLQAQSQVGQTFNSLHLVTHGSDGSLQLGKCRVERKQSRRLCGSIDRLAERADRGRRLLDLWV